MTNTKFNSEVSEHFLGEIYPDTLSAIATDGTAVDINGHTLSFTVVESIYQVMIHRKEQTAG